ncbi:MAG: alanine--tRNA ligase [Gammaproteobacteria bacterium]|jgi:alanyl-tRNA synthetase|uniref:alanine--tRNA ligase n=1 Tax=Stutzerimonas xanthomarina TaxID=271420 RepID=UPI000E91CC7C|nr:alanine--tRNA ligase [Stutzerimonas xanthomarina]MBU0852770.1 alanine--tRNA ligase [Gammaproteobacteria bacterium]HAW23509.1 alanine--tRNA ligase [Pseudomonas sp.]MBK3848474.1 alanine--tRNA ligase [Stutzerimonas xanthomarina]MBU1300759.1 alanine--tRNA ligase [Gammaproteobacteria bacterium]MBU1457927.1 alanine--tRNA ligase [Gammaproteobacteria bacterium]|tara:strand:- start:7358 stop:9982 length:2625 start_codon:yes stop_codon:yes gene_type:complete
MKSAEIREAFLRFFEEKGHTRVASSSLIPANDPTLLFTNAGMNQFKDCFLGLEKRAYTRAATSQKCVRAGGKHNDLENVGYTARHHTFFEMLGNFSFGDYFKRDAINYAWEFLTSDKWLKLPKEKLWVTVYASDDEAYDIWTKEVGVPAERMVRIGDNKGAPYASDNFWAMGDTGPCGPCTEIFFDHGDHIWGGPPGSPEEDGDRYIEIWNNVFMQFNRTADGVMHPLPAPSVDTGMGLERISAVLQHVNSNYEIDLFQSLLNAAAQAIGCSNEGQASLKVVADHIRSCGFLIADGVTPSNEGRGYVLRRIVRRACRHGNKLGAKGSFFYKLVAALAAEMGDAFSELRTLQAHIERVLKTEEEQFAKTLEQGLKILEQDLADLQGSVIPGDVIFKLYDTYGFPVDLTGDIARERELTLDEEGFEREMEAQRERARSASAFGMDYNSLVKVEGETRFTGYMGTSGSGKVLALFKEGIAVQSLSAGEEGVVVLDETPFYAESGGQAGDCGYLSADDLRFDVRDTSKAGGAFLHHGILDSGNLQVGASVEATVDASVRQSTALNHSATHLLHAALRQMLGEHVSQKGSLVDSQRLRFDFSHFEAIKPEQLKALEDKVNAEIRNNSAVETEETDIETAKSKGAMALFGEKYGDQVRVLTMGGGFSVELCGGTHVKRTGDIGLFKIVSEGGVAAGVRRIEAVTGEQALAYLNRAEEQLKEVAGLVKGSRDNLLDKLGAMLERNRQLEKELEQLKAKAASATGNDLASAAVDVKGVKTLAARIDGLDGKALLALVDQLKNKLGSGVILLGGVQDEKIVLVAGVTQDLTGRLKAGELMKQAAAVVGGKGGGRPDMAQGGGSDVSRLDEALAIAEGFVANGL